MAENKTCVEPVTLMSERDDSRVFSPGNPVFTYSKQSAPIKNVPLSVPLCESADVLYRTTNGEYGLRGLTVHTAPSTYWPRDNEFTDHLGRCGMYRNRSLNTAIDKCQLLN